MTVWITLYHTQKRDVRWFVFFFYNALNLSSPAKHAKYMPGNQECRTEHTAAHNRLCRSATLQITTYPFQIAVASQPLIQFYASTHQFKDNGALTRLVYFEITVWFWCHRGLTVCFCYCTCSFLLHLFPVSAIIENLWLPAQTATSSIMR